ncbi:MAG: pyruvate dehydrogenase complex dihydrolipoamide acetyltransferase [Pyrinomonadaceae bacterium]|nr:pyruvate dehydrogenase complex dihydrolipoamide acetyltransferase [Pyrinomonadaceae bacterium]
MAEKFLMPKLSPTMEEGQIARWLKNEGESYESGETLAEVDTDKATMELTALKGGTLLKILKGGGETALLGETIAIVGKAGEDFSALLAEVGNGSNGAAAKKAEEPAKAEETKPQETKPVETPKAEDQKPKIEDGRLLVSPIAAKMATENGIDLRTISGSGPQGRIIKRDIEAAMESKVQSPKSQVSSPSFSPSQLFGASAFREENTSKMRQVIAQRLTASTQNIPHFYLTVEIEMDNVLALRKQINATVSDTEKVSVNDIIVKASAMALIKHPWVNASFQDKTVRFYEDADISVAVAIEDGLITPVVRAANKKGILAISAEIKELAGRAKAKKLQPEEYTGGTFSISNLGMFGIQEFTAIINPPEAAIIAVGGASEKAVVRNGEIVIRSIMNVTMSCDHRVVDGATGAKFLQTFKQMLENPAMMLL